MQKIRGAALLAATALAVSGLAACGDEGEPTESSSTASPSAPEKSSTASSRAPEKSSTTQPTGSSTSAAGRGSGEGEVAELPAVAKKRTKDGAIAFNIFYQLRMGEALRTGETGTLKKYSKDCKPCTEYIRQTDADTARGVKMDKNPNGVGRTSATRQGDGGYKVSVTINADEYHEVMPDGSSGRTAKAITYTVETNTQWHDGHWVIQDSDLVE